MYSDDYSTEFEVVTIEQQIDKLRQEADEVLRDIRNLEQQLKELDGSDGSSQQVRYDTLNTLYQTRQHEYQNLMAYIQRKENVRSAFK